MQKGFKAFKTFRQLKAECYKLNREEQKDKHWNIGAEIFYQPLLALSHFIVFNRAPNIPMSY